MADWEALQGSGWKMAYQTEQELAMAQHKVARHLPYS